MRVFYLPVIMKVTAVCAQVDIVCDLDALGNRHKAREHVHQAPSQSWVVVDNDTEALESAYKYRNAAKFNTHNMRAMVAPCCSALISGRLQANQSGTTVG